MSTTAPLPRFAVYPSLQDAAVIVTGGASGIGAEIVRAFAGQGSHVGFVDIDGDGGRTLAAALAAAIDTDRNEASALMRAIESVAARERMSTSDAPWARITANRPNVIVITAG